MDESNGESIMEEHRIITEKTKAGIEKLEHDIKETVKFMILDQWDPDNQEIIDQLSELVNKSEELKQQITLRDIEIFKLRGTLSDKRKHVKESRYSLDSLRSTINRLEEAIVIPIKYNRDLIILDQSDKITELFEKNSALPRKTLCKSPKLSDRTSNNFIPISGYQGIYLTNSKTKPEDKGKQELSMPFLSSSGQNWISSLRTSGKTPLKSDRHK